MPVNPTFANLTYETTESADVRFADLDAWPPETVLEILWESQLAAVAAVRPALGPLASACRAAAARLAAGGRLVYTGAGTSARIAAQDGAELGPTFGWPSERVLVLPAGGTEALLRAIENAEDDGESAAKTVTQHAIGAQDVVLALAASGTTPYSVMLLNAARRAGALTIGIANSPGTALLEAAEYPVLIETGAEAIAGSTRLKAGTAQKVVLNLFSSVVMILLSHVYRGRMVDLQITNAKLGRRAIRTICDLAGVGEDVAASLLARAQGNIKRALLLARGLTPEEADRALARQGGNLRAALASLDHPSA
ncbi:MAG TPA: N-acetylmuramic acid 6-phosphate etherase [Acetobacteraceae bacterium]|jgi:N-acetylmuramic acid 6-phosphate etherase|nr:N-acetylmuramic acid 6-phosphate etherase [Acetobacteraceae bacterium]